MAIFDQGQSEQAAAQFRDIAEKFDQRYCIAAVYYEATANYMKEIRERYPETHLSKKDQPLYG